LAWWLFAKLGFSVGFCGFANVPLVRLVKIDFKKSAVGKKLKTLGWLEFRLTSWLLAIWSICFWSPIKLLCLCFNL